MLMIYPPLDELLKHADNRFMLAIVAAKRARQIIGEGHTENEYSDKAVTIALGEIVCNKTKFEKIKTGIK
jgi:DNA-directed RNA polymerase, omega subunit